MSCKYAQFRARSTHSAQLLPHFPPQSLPGVSSSPQSRAAASMLRPPLPGTPPPAPRGRFSSLTVAAPGLLRRHGCTLCGARSPPLSTCNAARRPLSRRRSQSSPQVPAKEKRALLFRGKTPSSRDTSCSSSRPPRPRPQRREIWRRERTWVLVSVPWELRLISPWFRASLTATDSRMLTHRMVLQ